MLVMSIYPERRARKKNASPLDICVQGIKQVIASMAQIISTACNAHVVHTIINFLANSVSKNTSTAAHEELTYSAPTYPFGCHFPLNNPKLHDRITSRSQSLSRTQVIHSDGWLLASPNRAFSIKNSIPTISLLVDRDVMGQSRQEVQFTLDPTEYFLRWEEDL